MLSSLKGNLGPLGMATSKNPCARISWLNVGATYWPDYAACIARVMAATVASGDTLTTPTGVYPGGIAYAGGVLLPDGRVFCVPYNATSARIYNPVTDTLTTPTGVYPGGNAYAGGVLLPDGRVFCVPFSATSARIYDAAYTVPFGLNIILSAYFNKR